MPSRDKRESYNGSPRAGSPTSYQSKNERYEKMQITQAQLDLVNDRIRALVEAGSFYGKKLAEAGNPRGFYNDDLDACVGEIMTYLRANL